MSNTSFLLLAWLLLSLSAPTLANEMTHLLKELAKPYSDLIEGLDSEIRQQSSQIYQYLTKSSKSEDQEEGFPVISEPANSETRKSSADEFKTVEDIKTYLKELSADEHKRRLQTDFCIHGVPVATTRHFFFCDGVVVNKEVYEGKGGSTNPACGIFSIDNWYFCYCPYDYYGKFCEVHISIAAEIEPLHKYNECQVEDSYEFFDPHGGLAPCTQTVEGDVHTFEYKISLSPSSSHQQWYYEGIKERNAYYDPFTPPPPFNYAIQTPKINLTHIPANTTLSVSFIDFNYMTRTIDFSVALTEAELKGIQNAIVPVTINELVKKTAIGGRYHYETNVGSNAVNITLKNGHMGSLEQAGYKEPQSVKQSDNKPLIILLIVL